MQRAILTAAIILAALFVPCARAASYGDFKKGMAAANEAIAKRDFGKARDILESLSENALSQGPASATDHAISYAGLLNALGEHEGAHAVLDRALEKVGPRPVAPKSQAARGVLLALKADVLAGERKYEACIPLAQEAAQILEQVFGKFHPQLFFLNWIIGDAYRGLNKPAEAEGAYKSALKLAQSRHHYAVPVTGMDYGAVVFRGDNAPFGVVAVNTALGDLYLKQSKFNEAEEAYKAGLKAAEADFGKKHPAVASPLRGLALAHHALKRSKEFDAVVQRIQELATKTQGLPLHAADPIWLRFLEAMKSSDNAMAEKTAGQIIDLHAAQKFETRHIASRIPNNAEAHAVFRKAFDTKFTAQSPQATTGILELAGAAERAKQPAIARAHYEAVVAAQQTAADKIFLTSALTRLSELSLAEGDTAAALAHRQQVTRLLRERYRDDSRVAGSLEAEANLLKKSGKGEEAAKLEAEALEIRTKAFQKR